MGASPSLRRLHSIREAEERQRRAQMESALADLRRLENALNCAFKKATQARALVASSVESGEQIDRIAALEEMAAAERQIKILPARIAAAETNVDSIRREFLTKRMERRQVESLLDAACAQETMEVKRKSQSVLDDCHLLQRTHKSKPNRSTTSGI
jgi:hypothetical protein